MSNSGSNYFPALDKCLSGETRLISWKAAYRAISDNHATLDNSALEQFFGDVEALTVLSNPLKPFPAPTSKSANDFDTKTAPINVSQCNNGTYNLEELKSDAKWLSQEMQVEELVALRMVVIEWQARSADQLLSALSFDYDFLAGFAARASTSTALGLASTPSLDFADEKQRRQRLLVVYFSECAHILKLSADMVGQGVTHKLESSERQKQAGKRSKWTDDLVSTITDRISSSEPSTPGASTLRLVEAVADAFSRAIDPALWPATVKQDPAWESIFFGFQYEYLLHVLRLLLSTVYLHSSIAPPSIVMKWFATMQSSQFLQHGLPIFEGFDISIAQYLISIISFEMLKPKQTLQALASRIAQPPAAHTSTYIDNDECTIFITTVMYECASQQITIAGPAITAWSIITGLVQDVARQQREMHERLLDYQTEHDSDLRSSRRDSRDPLSAFERLADKLTPRDMDDAQQDSARFLLGVAVDQMKVFAMIALAVPTISATFAATSESATPYISRMIFLDLIGECLMLVDYGPEVLDVALALLLPNEYSKSSAHHSKLLARKVLMDESQFGPILLDQALARYPYELSPMLNLFTAVASAANVDGAAGGPSVTFFTLDDLNSLTQMVPESFRSYELEHEDDNANNIILSDALPIFVTRQDLLSWNADHYGQRTLQSGQSQETHDIKTVSAGTPGILVKETRPFVIKLEYRHSGLELLGLLLSTFRTGSELVPAAPNSALDRFKVAEIISLFTAMLNAALDQDEGIDEAKTVLQRLGSALTEGQDIIFIVNELLDAELLAFLDQDAKEGSPELVSSCVEFLLPIARIYPERIWSLLSRSSLLGVVDGSVSLASVVGGFEVQIGHYRFLRACVELHALLVDDAVAGLVRRKSQASKSLNRFDSAVDSQESTPDRAMSTVLNAFQRVLLDVLQNIPRWKFASVDEKCIITTTIAKSFTLLLERTYGVDVEKTPSQRLTYVLGPAAEAALDTCTSQVDRASLLNSLGRLLHEGLASADDLAPSHTRLLLDSRTRSVLRFLTILIRAVTSNIQLTKITSTSHSISDHALQYCTGVLEYMPVFACLLAGGQSFRAQTFGLLTELVSAIGSGKNEPPSILGHLSAGAAKAFLEVAIQSAESFADSEAESNVWDFLTSVMANRQQWCAMYLLTGTLPKDRAHRSDKDAAQTKPLFWSVLDQLASISTLSPVRAVGMLRFLAAAQQAWAWANSRLRSHPDFLKNVLEWLNGLQEIPKESSSAAALIAAREYEMAASICEILAVNLHASLEIGDKSVLKLIMSNFTFLREHSTSALAFNKALHRKLAENLARKFPTSELSDFKRTGVNPAPLGTEFYYDRGFATSVLQHDKSWHGADHGRSQGFLEEFGRANANHSLVHAQYLLLKGVRALATTLCECIDQETSVAGGLAGIARSCLLANASPHLDEPSAAEVLETRLDVAFVVLSKLGSATSLDSAETRSLLFAAWELVRTSPVDYDVASEAHDFRYYRKLLQVLYLAIQIQSSTISKSPASNAADKPDYLDPAVASCLVSIVGKVVATGFRALCGNLHNDIGLASPADFGLLTAILQALLAIPGVNSVYALLSDIVVNSSIARGALSLYSWADQLAELTEQDPVYGEVAITMLVSLSSIPAVAEQIAIDGVLTQLSAANLSNYFRKPGGKGPFDEPPRMFTIWTEGLLPLCLNLLDAVGPAIAGEVAAFLNSFPKQLARAQKSLQNEAPSPRNPHAGTITMGLVAEAHSLSMIATILRSDVARAAAEGILATDVAALEYDLEAVKATVEGLTRAKRSFHDRIRPSNPLERRWEGTPASGVSDNLLQAKVTRELSNMLACFGDGGGSS